MSVLADLLSKTKKAVQPEGKGVPPTLARANASAAAAPGLKKRFIVMSVIGLAAILVGIILPSQFRRITTALSAKKTVAAAPQPAKMPLPDRTPPPQAQAPEAVTEDAKKTAAGATPPKAAGPAPGEAKTATAPETISQKVVSEVKNSVARLAAKTTRKPELAAEKPKPAKTAAKKPSDSAGGKIDTNARSALLYAARASEQAGDWRGALASYRAALDTDPDNFRILSNISAAYNKLGMYAEGEREARKALERKPNYLPAMINAAIACSSQGNNKDALEFFHTALAADPNNKSLALNLGVLQERSGNLDEALATYRRGAASGDPQALYGIGRINDLKGNRSEAITAYKLIMLQKNVDPALKRDIKNRLVRLEEHS